MLFLQISEFCFSQSNSINVYKMQNVAEGKDRRMYVDVFLQG